MTNDVVTSKQILFIVFSVTKYNFIKIIILFYTFTNIKNYLN